MNYELTEVEKEKLVEKTETTFNQYFDKMQNYQNIDLDKANNKTMVVKISLLDFVNKVPSLRQTDGFTQLYLRQFGEATLHIEIWRNEDQSLLFKGYVREDIEPIGRDFEKANTINARQQTYLQLKRWAKGLQKELDAM